MKTLELKANLHNLIDKTENIDLLESIHEILSNPQPATGKIWADLSEADKNKVLEAWDESEKTENLIPHELALNQIR